MLQSPRAQQTRPFSPRDVAHPRSLSPGSRGLHLNQRQILEMAFEGDSGHHPRGLDGSELELDHALSPRSTGSHHSGYGSDYYAPNPHVSRLSLYDSHRSSGGSWHDISGVTAPTTPMYSMMGLASLATDDGSAEVEFNNPELFQAGVVEHAQHLGIDPYREPELMWIARDSLVAPLPEDWIHQEATSTKAPYYYNVRTGVSQWEHPSDQVFRLQVLHEKRRLGLYHGGSDQQSPRESTHSASFYEQHQAFSGGETDAWHGEYDPSNSDYRHSGDWGSVSSNEQARYYYQGYEDQSGSATISSSRGYEDSGAAEVADSHSTMVVSGREHCVRGNGSLSPSLAELDSLKAQVEDLERKNNELEDQRHQDDALILKLESQVKNLLERVEKQSPRNADTIPRVEKEELQDLVVELRAALDESKASVRNLEVENDRLREIGLKSSADDADIQRNQETNHASELSDLRKQVDDYRTQQAKLDDELQFHRDQISTVTDELSAARSEIKQLHGDLQRQAKAEQVAQETAAAVAANAVASAEEKVSFLTSQLSQREEALKSAKVEVVELRREIQILKDDHEGTLLSITKQLEQELEKHKAESFEMSSQIRAMEETIRASNQENGVLEIKIEQQRQEAAVREAEFEDQQRILKREIRGLERDLKALQSISKEREDELDNAKRLISSLEQKLQEQDKLVEDARRIAFEAAEQAAAETIRIIQGEKARVAELYAQELQTRRKLHNRLMELQGNIRVFCRVRPIQAIEMKSEQSSPAVFFRDEDHESLDLVVGGEIGPDGRLLNGAGQKYPFEFDHVFQPNSSQNEVFEQTKALVTSALDGFNVCIFAYGQTGSGKTHTMEGSASDQGLYYRSLKELFRIREERTAAGNFECTMKLSMLEVYNEAIVDLLDSSPSPVGVDQRKGLEARMGKQGVYVENLIEVEVYNEKDVTDLMQLGKSHRSVGAHDFNEHSSRSHLVLSIAIETFQKTDNKRRWSKLHLIDLAGSERVSKTAASGQRLKEAQNINRSLSALGDVIAALGANSKHVPYRNSKLTFLLQESLSGNSKVLMFVNISPVQWNAQETLCSLNFASRCRNVALGMAKVNSGSSEISSSSPSNSKEAPRTVSTVPTTSSGSKQRPPFPSPAVKGAQKVVFG